MQLIFIYVTDIGLWEKWEELMVNLLKDIMLQWLRFGFIQQEYLVEIEATAILPD